MAAAQRFTAWLGCVALLACGPSDAPRPSFLLITLDTTRADRIGTYGAESAHTPTIDHLAREGVVFEMALAPTPLTLPSHASILTGVYPATHGVRNNGLFVLPPEATLVSEVLRESGWSTGAFVAAYVLDARFGLDQGFQVYRGVRAKHMKGRHFERPADQVVDDALEWLHSLDPGEPFFEFLLTLSADLGINLLSFTPNPGTEVEEITLGDGGSLLLEGGSKNSAQAGPFRLGRLLLKGLVPFSELVLRLLDQDDSLPGYVDQEFEYIDVPIPLVIASVPVPEPGALRLLLLTGLALGLLRPRPAAA